MNQVPTVCFVTGLPGSGKTYFAKRYAQHLKADYMASDQVRKWIFAQRQYTSIEKDQVYAQMLQMMTESLSQGRNAVVDGTFCLPTHRAQFQEEAIRLGARVVWMHTRADEDVIRQRLAKAREDSEADWEVYLKLKGECSPLQGNYLKLDTTFADVESLMAAADEFITSLP